MKILLVEDNNSLALNIAEYFERKKFIVDYAADGVVALNLALSQRFDVIVLDIMMPRLDGFGFCRKFRDSDFGETPIIMLTAKDTEQDKLTGFSVGADDYLVKPFSLPELEARILALTRRGKQLYSRKKELVFEQIVYSPATMKLKRGGAVMRLKPVPLKILVFLLQYPNQVVTRESIEQEIWNGEAPESEVLRSHVYAIRREINKHGLPNILHTIRGVGYMLGDDNS